MNRFYKVTCHLLVLSFIVTETASSPSLCRVYIHPTCLPTDKMFKRSNTFRGKLLEVAGWGADFRDSRDPSGDTLTFPGDLQTTSLQYVPKHQCDRAYGRRLSPTKMCAGGEVGWDACMGDSGGPLMGRFSPHWSRNRYFLIGIVSFSDEKMCGQSTLPGVYANVAQLVDWVLDNIYN